MAGAKVATLFAIWKVLRADADLHDPRLVDTSDAYIFKHAVIDFALARRLDDNFLAAGDQRPAADPCLRGRQHARSPRPIRCRPFEVE